MPGRARTAEFMATVNSRREKPQWIQQRRDTSTYAEQKHNKLAIDPQYGEFMNVSKVCANRIRDSFEKLEKFTHLAKRRTVFDDGEMNRLIEEIRKDIGESKSQLDYLQSKHATKQRHSENIVTTLQQRLANETSNFKSTLELRSKGIQQQTARQELYGAPSSSGGGGGSSGSYQQHNNKHQPSYPFDLHSGPSTSSADMYAAGASNSTSPVLIDMQSQQYQQQQYLLPVGDEVADRADKMQLIESTIVELSTVFNQLADMVQSQGETITRIDMNISETTGNVEAAHDALLRYFASINSNRWLMLKVFGVLFFFFVVFVMFAS